MKFALIVTSQNFKYITRLLGSLEKQSWVDGITVIYVNQVGTPLESKSNSQRYTLKELIVKPMSLSEARNVGLKALENEEFIGFPDDDCWYGHDVISNVADIFKLSGADVVCLNVYDPISGQYYGNRSRVRKWVSRWTLYSLPISVGIFCKNHYVQNHCFHNNFGVGARFGCGEETLYIADSVYNRKCFYDGLQDVYHEVPHSFAHAKVLKYSYGFAKMIKELNDWLGYIYLIFLILGSVFKAMFALVRLRVNSSIEKLVRAVGLLLGMIW